MENPALANDLQREYDALVDRRSFGLNFERHVPEAVELPGRRVRKGDKVRVLPERGTARIADDDRLWRVVSVRTVDGMRWAGLVSIDDAEDDKSVVATDLVVVAEFRDPIYPGLVSTGKVERGGDKPFHTVINAENFHALQSLLFTNRGKVDCIYIDPPYNTGARDWMYNNDYVEGDDIYRHSKWLAFMERRLQLAKELLNPTDSVLVVAIDEKEYLRLGLLLQQVFEDATIQMVSIAINPAAVARAGAFGRTDEYAFFVQLGAAAPSRVRLSRDWVSERGRTHTGNVRWDLLRRSGEGASRSDSPGCFYPIYVDPDGPKVREVGAALPRGVSEPAPIDGCVAVLPIRKDGTEGRWQWAPQTFRERLAQGRVRISGSSEKGFVVSILKDGEFAKTQRGEFGEPEMDENGALVVGDVDVSTVIAVPGTQWKISAHDSTQYGSRLLSSFIPGRRFPFPKALYAVEDVIRFYVAQKPSAVVVDFFAGSGTTAHAVMRLNRQDGGQRRSISVTNNEVSSIVRKELQARGLRPADPDWEQWGVCEYITKPRIAAAINGVTPDGELIKGDYKFTDEFPMSEGFEENVEFFTLMYEAPLRVASNREFAKIAPLLWMRAGAQGRRIDDMSRGWDVADVYGVISDLDTSETFLKAIAEVDSVATVFIVTDEDGLFEQLVAALPDHLEPVRLYEAYLRNFEIEAGRGIR